MRRALLPWARAFEGGQLSSQNSCPLNRQPYPAAFTVAPLPETFDTLPQERARTGEIMHVAHARADEDVHARRRFERARFAGRVALRPIIAINLRASSVLAIAIPRMGKTLSRLFFFENLERAKGFEPSTPTLARLCSTPELRPLWRRLQSLLRRVRRAPSIASADRQAQIVRPKESAPSLAQKRLSTPYAGGAAAQYRTMGD